MEETLNCSTNHSYEEWVKSGCPSEKWGDYEVKLPLMKALGNMFEYPIKMVYHQIRFKFNEVWRKVDMYIHRMFLGYSPDECSCSYLCTQECYKSLRYASFGCDLCGLVFSLRDAVWYIKPSSKLSYRLASMDLYDYVIFFTNEMDFAVEIMQNYHTMEECEEHKGEIDRRCDELFRTFIRNLKGGKEYEQMGKEN